MKKKIIPVFLLIAVCAGFGFWHLGARSSSLVLRGEVEGTVYSHVSEVPGRIAEMKAELGSPVKSGSLLARLDNTDELYALEQLQIVLEKRRLTLRNYMKGARHEELEKARKDIVIAEANYRSAEASYRQAREDTETLTKLWEDGGFSKSELDRTKLRETTAAETFEAARGQAGKAREQLSLLLKGTDTEIIAMAEMDIKETESRIRQLQEKLSKYEIKAICDGTVISINYNLGTVINAGYNIADISSGSEKYVVCYVPKKNIMQISYGQLLTIKAAGEEYRGEVRFIDVKSQYTPKDMQNSAMKNKISVKVKILLPADTPLKPGDMVIVKS